MDRKQMVQHFGGGIIAEIGVFMGDFSQHILDTCHPHELYLIDLWKQQTGKYECDPTNKEPLEQYYEDVCKRFQNALEVRIVRKYSLVAAAMFPDHFFDWIYLDCDHTYDSVKNDWFAWKPKVKKGGWFAGHDWTDGCCAWVEVKQALTDCGVVPDIITDEEWPSWAVKLP